MAYINSIAHVSSFQSRVRSLYDLCTDQSDSRFALLTAGCGHAITCKRSHSDHSEPSFARPYQHVCACAVEREPRIQPKFTRPFSSFWGWGLGTRLIIYWPYVLPYRIYISLLFQRCTFNIFQLMRMRNDTTKRSLTESIWSLQLREKKTPT